MYFYVQSAAHIAALGVSREQGGRAQRGSVGWAEKERTRTCGIGFGKRFLSDPGTAKWGFNAARPRR